MVSLFAGSSNPELAYELSNLFNISLGKVTIKRFSDGEIYIKLDEDVTNKSVYVMQSICSPAGEHMLELLIMIDALKRSVCSEIFLIIPYLGYSRQDRMVCYGEPITAKLIADLISNSGVKKVITIDLHSTQIQGFFNIPVLNLSVEDEMISYIESSGINTNNLVVVSPDFGSIRKARSFANKLNVPLVYIEKIRPRHNEAEVLRVIGDVKGKVALIYDDIVDTAGTMCLAAEFLKENGAIEIYAMCTHPVLSGEAINKINSSQIQELVVTNTIPIDSKVIKSQKIKVISASSIISKVL